MTGRVTQTVIPSTGHFTPLIAKQERHKWLHIPNLRYYRKLWLATGLTITPGTGDYLVWFTGTLWNQGTDVDAWSSIYANNSQLAHSERKYAGEGSMTDNPWPTMTHALVTGLGAGQDIEVRWRTQSGTAEML